MTHYPAILSLILLLNLSAAPVRAQNTPEGTFPEQLKNLYASYQQDPAGSCKRLQDMLQTPEAASLNAQDAKKAYHFLGHCNYRQKHPDKAVSAYLKTAELDPSDAQPLIDAGSVYVEEGLYAEAEARYREALQRASGDSDLEKKIIAMISHIPGKLQRKFTVSTSLGHDSNVNSGPDDIIHLLYGVFNYTLDSNDKPRADFYSYNNAGAALTKALNPKTYLLFNANAGQTFYFSEEKFNTSVLSASAGYKKIFNDKSVTFSPFVNYQTLDGNSYQISRGFSVAGAVMASKKINVWPSINAYAQDFYNDKLRDALGFSVGSSASCQLGARTSWISSLFYSLNDAKNNLYTYNSIFFGNSLRQTLSENLAGTIGYNLQWFDYDAMNPLFGTTRRDIGQTAYISLDYSLKKFLKTNNAFLNLSVSRTQDNSNQSFYDNHRVFSSLKFTYSF